MPQNQTQPNRIPILLDHATVATMVGSEPVLEDGAVLIKDGTIAWVGPSNEVSRSVPIDDGEALDVHSCQGRLLTPGLIDCHTHLVYGGDRSAEFEQRLEGISYEDIAKSGGGIVSTVRATREATEEELLRTALQRLDCLLADGVTTVEIKSGYGLDVETEVRCLEIARSLEQHRPVSILPTYLGAHAIPPEFSRDDSSTPSGRTAYLDLVCDQALPQVTEQGLACAVDGFCEGIAFSPEEISRVFQRAQDLGLPVKLHAEQLSNLGGSALAASFDALSVDHLEYLDQSGVEAIAKSGTVAVLLPGAFYYLRETQSPPVDLLRQHGVPIALGTDLNPGSSPVHSLLTTMNMGCVLFELTPTEVLRAVTANAAQALGLEDRGRIAPGCRADLALWNVREPVGLCYPLGHSPCQAVFKDGELVRGSVTDLERQEPNHQDRDRQNPDSKNQDCGALS